MLITTEHDWYTFPFSLQAEETVDTLNKKEMDIVWNILETQYFQNGVDKCVLNDFFIDETNIIANWLGYDSWEQLKAEKELEE